MARVLALSELRRSPTAALFEGGDDAPVSIFVTEYPRDRGPDLHTHPYPEVFVVHEGVATFTAGDEELVVEAGHVVVVPAETVHGFKNRHGGTLRVTSVHPSDHVVQRNL